MTTGECKVKLTLTAIGLVLAFCMTAFFANWSRGWLSPEPIGQERTELRLKHLEELRAASREELANWGWQDEARGIVRIPIARAMELTVREWRDPAAGRALLIERYQQVTIPLDQIYE